jgi:hypothetical protein
VIVVTAFVAITTFMGALSLLRVAPVAGQALATAQRTTAVIRDPAFDDRARERAARRAAFRLAAAGGSIVIRTLLAAAASFLPIWFAGASGVASTAQVVKFLTQWQGALVATLVATIAYLFRLRLWRTS